MLGEDPLQLNSGTLPSVAVPTAVRISFPSTQLHLQAPTSEMLPGPLGTTMKGWTGSVREATLGKAKGTLRAVGNKVSPQSLKLTHLKWPRH